MASGSLTDVTKALTATFTATRVLLSLPTETRRILQAFVDEHDGDFSAEESEKINSELKAFYGKHVAEHYVRYGAFVGVLRELRPALTQDTHLLEWWELIVRPIVGGTAYKKQAVDDAQDFLVGIMVYEEQDDETSSSSRLAGHLCKLLLMMYVDRTKPIEDHASWTARDNAQAVQQLETALLAFGKKKPRYLFNALDDLIVPAETRLQALSLLSAFLRNQTPHLYLVIHTPLVEHLLKCLLNDTSTAVLSVALTALMMLMPHIPGSLAPHLPGLFLVYSRILCWEKFSPLSTQDQRKLVTDDRIDPESDSDRDQEDVGIDPAWESVQPANGDIEAQTPELMTYFTYLYGLYPLNFMSYIRKPRRYLRNISFPGADDFDLDQAVIRSRTERYQQMHLLHPNFYSMTVDEELDDPKWPNMDPADVVAECHRLSTNSRPILAAPVGPPPSSKLPDVPPIRTLTVSAFGGQPRSGAVSPVTSHASFISGSSWRNTQTTAVASSVTEAESPVLRPLGAKLDYEDTRELRSKASQGTLNTDVSSSLHELPRPGIGGSRSLSEKVTDAAPPTNIAYLELQVTLLRNDLNFERWHKVQYATHIGHLQRRNNKDASVGAKTLNLINANRALAQKLADAQSVRETTLRDIQLGKKQVNNYESQLQEQLKDLKAAQMSWNADASELQRLRDETKHYRDLLVAAEARELNKSHELEIIQRDVDQLESLRAKLTELQRKVRDFERREFEFDSAQLEMELAQDEKVTLEMKLRNRDQQRDGMKKAYADRVAELESQINAAEAWSPRQLINQAPPDVQSMIQFAIAESQTKLMQLNKAHGRLLERHAALETEYQDVKSQLSDLQIQTYGYSYVKDGRGKGDYRMSGALNSSSEYHDNDSFVRARSEAAYPDASKTDRLSPQRIHLPVRGGPTSPKASMSPSGSDSATFNNNSSNSGGMSWKPASAIQTSNIERERSVASRLSSIPSIFNQTTPLGHDEMLRQEGTSSVRSDDSDEKRRKAEKIQPQSEIRVYGRGGAQNIKLKSKDKAARDDKSLKTGGFKGLRGIIQGKP